MRKINIPSSTTNRLSNGKFITRDPFNTRDTISIWQVVRPAVLTVTIFIVSLWSLAFWPDFREWLDKTFDRSDQQRTGIVLLLLFTLCFGVCLRLAAKK